METASASERPKELQNMKKELKKNLIHTGREYAVLTVLVLFGICFVYQVWKMDIMNTPLCYTQDGITTLVSQKCLIEEGGWTMTCSRLGAPYGQNTSDFTTATFLPIVLLKIGAVLTDNWVWGLNLSYFIGYFIMAWICYYILKKIRISVAFSMTLAVLYTFLPFHMLRSTEHFALSFYALTPVSIYYVLLSMEADFRKWKEIPRHEKAGFIIWMILAGMNGIYYSFFTCFLFCVAILYNLLQKNGAQSIKKCLLGIGNIMIGVMLASLPSFIYIIRNGGNTETVHRLRSEIAIYALRVSQLLLPITQHRIPLFAQIKEVYNNSFVPNENDSASLGIVFSVGFIILCIYLLKEKRKENDIMGKLAALNICMVVYASVGGLVEIQSIIFKLIRCSNRISVFIAFVCCVAVGILLERLSENKISGRKKIIIAVIVLVLGILDQTRASYFEEGVREKMESERTFIAAIESMEAEGAMIFQLPNVVYPEQGMKERMGDYSHFIGYLYSDTLRWSYGSMKGREGSKILEEICKKETPEMIAAMKKEGFEGIYIDRWGYKEEEVEQLEKEIQEILKISPVEGGEGRYAYYSFKNGE